MKKILSLLAIAVVAMQLSAATVDLATAKNTAKQYMQNKVYAGKIMAPAATDPVLLMQEMGDVNTTTPVYYIFNTSTGFIIVSGDDRAEEVLAYGDRPLSLDRMPENMKAWLAGYKEQIDFLISNPDLKVRKTSTYKSPTLRATTYGPLLTCNWDQETPYNNLCKFTYSGTTYTCYTGCPATSASMVLYYWKYPTAATGQIPAYTSTLDLSSYNSVNFTYSALSSTTFDWDNMLDDYTGSYTTAQGNAVATLMRYVGQAEHMMYGTSSAGGSGIDVDATQDIVDMFTFFGYDESTTRLVKKTSSYYSSTELYTDDEWAAMIQEEMIAGRPIVFCAVSSYGGGHAFNVDGYNSSTNKYHINFGWSGDGNAWCALNSFSYSGYNFNQYQQMVIGIQPPQASDAPTITASASSLDMACYTGETATATFTVTGANLTDAVSVDLTDANGVFSVNPTNVSVSDAESGKTVTVTFAPEEAGTYTGTITLTSTDAKTVTVALNGTATIETGALTLQEAADVNSTSFKAVWTDETPAANVASYTLWVNVDEPVDIELLGTVDGSAYTGGYSSITLSEPWGGKNVKGGYGAVYFSNSSSSGNITFTIPEGYNNATFSMRITTSSGNYGSGNLTVKSAQTEAVGHSFSAGETYTWLVQGSAGETITITSTDASYSPDMALIEVYSGDVTQQTNALRGVVEEGDASQRIITGITNKYYTVNNLTSEATYFFKVKALYVDGTESAWSETKQVTLSAEQQALLGDVNLDGVVDVTDVNIVVNIILGNDDAANYDGRADLNGDGAVDVTDINLLVSIVMG